MSFLLKFLNQQLDKHVTYLFHVFGSFTFHALEWKACEDHLKERNILWVAASERQAKQLEVFLGPGARVFHSPYPIDTAFYSYNPSLRNSVRSKYNWSPHDRVFLYSGRLSLQKNVSFLLNELVPWLENSNARLCLAGPFDDLGAPFFSIRPILGEYYSHYCRLLESIPSYLREKITYAGNLSQEDLNGFYQASDVYINMSLHHDEDFGMAAAEALSSGMSAVLTDWGGLASFKAEKNLWPCHLVGVSLNEKGLLISSFDLGNVIEKMVFDEHNTKVRIQNSKAFDCNFSLVACAKKIQKLHSENGAAFKKFSPLLAEYCLQAKEAFLFKEMPSEKNILYKKIYQNYLTIQNQKRDIQYANTEEWFQRPSFKKIDFPQKLIGVCSSAYYVNIEGVVVRDGASILQSYFKRYPIPQKGQTYYFHQSLASQLPKKWKSVSRFYKIVKKSNKKEKEIRGTLLLGVFGPNWHEELLALQKFLKKMLKQSLTIPFYCYLPDVFVDIDVKKEISLNMSSLKIEVQFLSTNEFFFQDDLSDLVLLPVLGEGLYADNYTVHSAMARGVQVIRHKKEENLGKILADLSPYHALKEVVIID